MSQISPPIRILLVCAVAFMAAWMLFLRPKDDAGTPAAASPSPASTRPVEAGGDKAQSLAGKAVEKANEATAAQDAQAEQLAGGTGDTAATPSTSAAVTQQAAPAKTGAPAQVALPSKEALASVPAKVRNAILARKIIVLGVLSSKGIDDRLVRKQLADVDKLHGRVFVHAVPVKRISRYGAITRGADVSQTPSVVVVDFGLKATTLAGWVDAATIDQAVIDSIRYSGQINTDPYLRQVSEACNHAFPDLYLLVEPAGGSEYSQLVGGFATGARDLKADIGGLSTPTKWRSFRKGVRGDMTTLAATMASWHAALGRNPTLSQAISARDRYLPPANKSVKSVTARFDRHDVLGCGSKR
jgi:hypothetical protein